MRDGLVKGESPSDFGAGSTGDCDPVLHDQLIAAAEEIQEQSWWFQAMDA